MRSELAYDHLAPLQTDGAYMSSSSSGMTSMRFLHAPSGSLEMHNTMRGKDDAGLQVDPVLEAESRKVV